jgi:2-oxoisovalerate dehydrogenase E1 component beta subunit
MGAEPKIGKAATSAHGARTPMTMVQALRSAMDVALERDPNVVVFGEDVGYFGGVFRCTDGLQAKYGKSRVFDSPLSESGIVGTAVGMAAYGLRPVVEIQFADYFYPAYDQIVSEAARLRYRSAGDFSAPLVIRMPCGGGIYGGQTHSQSPEVLFTHGDAVQSLRREGAADRRDRVRRSGDLPRAQTPLQRPV